MIKTIKKTYAIMLYKLEEEFDNKFSYLKIIILPMIITGILLFGINQEQLKAIPYVRHLTMGVLTLFFINSSVGLRQPMDERRNLMLLLKNTPTSAPSIIFGLSIATFISRLFSITVIVLILELTKTTTNIPNIVPTILLAIFIALCFYCLSIAHHLLFTNQRILQKSYRYLLLILYSISGCFFTPFKEGILKTASFISPITHIINIMNYVNNTPLIYENILFSVIYVTILFIVSYMLATWVLNKKI